HPLFAVSGIVRKSRSDRGISTHRPVFPGAINPKAERGAELLQFRIDIAESLRETLGISLGKVAVVVNPELQRVAIKMTTRGALSLGHLGNVIQQKGFRLSEGILSARLRAERLKDGVRPIMPANYAAHPPLKVGEKTLSRLSAGRNDVNSFHAFKRVARIESRSRVLL